MVFVAIAALNFGAIRAWYGLENGTNNNLLDVLCLGALPMLNILGVGILIGLRHRGSRPFLLGFEVCGAVALALYVALAILFTDSLVRPYLFLVLNPLRRAIRQTGPSVIIPILYITIAVVWLSLPQLVFGLVGGLLARTFRVAGGPDQTRS
jgi:hypothetical protein